ncbi:transglycosylase SLT domain-containing protein [Litoribacter ruber]|uniref:Transglycosylase SLT domain-containing protein n=1 Tax=Litoribacter ruber TaxID=702568 RepID=A0AAP2G0J6_9BACT|nr:MULTISPECIES: lytic transglycosylase domain-containing protein [Litoribacter]MBS9522964.1 transglycosylase SLT domain-containing protein [Litoribacter alkaliphilus]MBT0810872.1 transglycosylase SLT domain-containing protein [Litoribacter ruber]
MKNLFKIFVLGLLLNAIYFSKAHSQELLEILNQSEPEEEEEMIYPVYDYEHIPDFTYDQVKQKIKKMDTDMPFELNERIYGFIDYFTVRNRSYTKMVLERKDTYFPLFEEALARHNMPDDIKFLAIIESGLNPKARSRVGAMGLWQFMPATGRMFNMHATQDIDERMDPELSTEAAAKYLKSLHKMFGNWELALAAYNCGPGNVRKAIRKSGGKTTFWGVYDFLPKETRGYVPQFQAMMYVLRHADDHNLILEDAAFPIAFERIKFEKSMDLEQFAGITGICIEDLDHLNPSILDRRIPESHKHFALKVPKAKAQYIAENQHWISDSLNIPTARLVAIKESDYTPQSSLTNDRVAYRVKSGDALGKIAQNHGVTVTNLKNWNNLSSNTIRIGQVLYIYPKGNTAFSRNLASSETPTSSSSSNAFDASSKTYTVQPGDSLWLISRKLDGVTIDQIKKLNNLNNNSIKPGQKLIIG